MLNLLVSQPRRTLLAALLFVIVAGAIGGPLAGSLKSSGSSAPSGADSEVAVRQIQAATHLEPTAGVVLLVNTPAGALASRARLASARIRLAAVAGIAQTTAPAAVARNGRLALLTGTLRAGAQDGKVAQSALHAFAHVRGVTVGGPAVAGRQISGTVSKDLGLAELIAFPLLLVLSLVFFRGRAALMPLIVGITTVLGTFLALTAVNHVYGLSVFALNLVIGLGLGLSIDYTLLLLTRFRDELGAGATAAQAIRTTISTAGRTIAFSAATVACALATLTLFSQGFLKSMGIAGATVALVAAAAALVLTPALLAVWGVKLARPGTRGQHGNGRWYRLARRRANARPEDGRWYRLAQAVTRRPGAVAAVTAVAMLALALPALSTLWSPIDSTAVPTGQSARTVSDATGRYFRGAGQAPVTVAIEASRSQQAGVAAYARRVASLHGVQHATRPAALGSSLWTVNAEVAGDPAGPAAQRVVREVRNLHAPFGTKVTGPAAEFVDQQAAIGSRLLPAIALLAGLTFLVLWLMTGSVVLPAKAIVMNALTVGVALASLVLVYQHGHLRGLLGYTPNGGVEPTDFVVTATLVFALSTDYGVFLLGRIKEAREEGLSERQAVAAGVGRTGRVITAAAILLAVAIGAFSTSSISFIQQIGLATATGVLVDAFIVRSLLVPSLMALLGRWNWWAPAPLRRLHDRIGGRATGGIEAHATDRVEASETHSAPRRRPANRPERPSAPGTRQST
ncbi:MAG: MMPL family transporter [Actinomycetota bacterium]|nr:MMPL family transporter [Actinomycetota bacterium]